MAYIESHQEIARHPKTLRFARRLGCSKNEAIGILHQLWWWAMDFAPDGDLTRFDAEEIAIAVEFEGAPDALMGALVAAGWVDKTPDDTGETIHDWQSYGGKFVQRKLANAERMRNARAGNVQCTQPTGKEVVQCTCGARATNDDGTCDACALINKAEQNKAEHISPQPPEGSDRSSSVADRFDTFWARYPRKVGKDAARKSWSRLKPSADVLALMLGAIDRQCQQQQWRDEGGRFIPNPATWLNQGRWQDEPTNITQFPEKPGEEAWRLRTAQY